MSSVVIFGIMFALLAPPTLLGIAIVCGKALLDVLKGWIRSVAAGK